MANLGSWDKTLPSGSSSLQDGDDDIRSNQSSVQDALEEEHFFTDSNASTGIHKLGSARAWVANASDRSHGGADWQGRLYFSEDSLDLSIGLDSSFTPVGHAWIGARVSNPSGFIAEEGEWTSITWADEEYDFAGVFASGTSSRLSVPTSGMYHVSCGIHLEGVFQRSNVAITRGIPFSVAEVLTANSGESGAQHLYTGTTVFLEEGDLVAAFFNATNTPSGSSISFAISGSESSLYHFSLHRVA